VTACVFAAFCEGFDLQAAGVAAAGIMAEFRPTASELGTFFSASSLGLFAGALLGGKLSDAMGRKRTLIMAISLFGLFSILTTLAGDIRVLAWARLATGAGLGGALPNLLALVNESSPASRRRANVALMYCGMPFGGALASLLSMLSAPDHWRWIFAAGGAAPLLLAPAMVWVVHESPVFGRPSLEAPAGLMPRSGSFAAIFAGGRAMPTLLLWISSFLGLLTLYLLLSWLPTLLVGSGFSKPEAAGAQIAFNVGGGLAALLLGQLLESRFRQATVLVTFLAVPIMVLFLSKTPHSLPLVVLVVFALGCAVIAGQCFLYAFAPGCYPTSIRGVGMGAVVAMGRLGSIAGPKLGGLLKAAGHGSAQLLMDILPLVVLGSLVALAFWGWISRDPSLQKPKASPV
jgi:AAHS family 3-hydroxyphenylpropionic acid transporter